MRKGNINVYIESQGHALPEYQVEIVDDKTVACYIPSEAGKNFMICWRADTRHDDHVTSVRPRIDGHNIYGKLHSPGQLDGFRESAQIPKDRKRRFEFATLATTDLLRVQGIIPSDAPAAGPSEQSTSARKRPIDRSRSDTPEEAGPSRKRVKTEERALVGEEEDADALELEVELKAIHARARAIEEKLRARAGVAQLKHEPESSNVMIDETRERVDREGSLTRLHTVLAG
ncbi:hypothetical protein FOMPIDRAFT_1054332 [Fomitopsis schrenkii]|uniref:DUF7918 domain-containing protein n=1 Tax=Fomitopsis schrenkii TaxID=2126942 RepID=S8DVP9_FOMSC|nr:hypothetical protein FOMPIDRAFT_1054332 [Fomitopsis schrenkii]